VLGVVPHKKDLLWGGKISRWGGGELSRGNCTQEGFNGIPIRNSL
jgi:hypothetical protein